MSAKLEQVEKNTVKLTIEVDAMTFDEAMEKSYAKNKGRYALQGFRKGKAPRHMIERMYGESIFYEDAINIACPPAYEKAIAELGIEPVDRPEIDVDKIGVGTPLIFTATVTVKPEVVLGQYLGLSVEKDSVMITDEDVEKELDRVRERNSRLITVEDRAVQNGDNLTIDFQGYSDGIAFEGGTGKDYSLVIGSGSFIPGFEEQLVGVELLTETEVNVVFPESYHSSELAGKEARFTVTVNQIKYREMPDLDDEFAKDVSEFDTLEAYKADIGRKLSTTATEGSERKFEEEVLKAAAANLSVEIPDAMVATQLNGILRQFDMNLRYQGMDLKKYMAMMGMKEDQLRADFRDNARENVKTQLLLEAVVKAEGIEASEEMIEAELAVMAKQYGQTVEEIRTQLHDHDMEHVMERACSNEAIRRMTDSAAAG